MSFFWSGSSAQEKFIDDSCVNKKIESWVQWGTGIMNKNFGNFSYDSLNNNSYSILPQDSRRDCNVSGIPDQNQSFTDSRSGNLTLNLTIDKNVFTPDVTEMLDFPTVITVNPEVLLKINDSRVLDLTEVISSNPDKYSELNIENTGALKLNTGAKIIIRNKNRVNLRYGSKLYLGSNSEILVKQGGLYCNEGALIRGNGKVIYEGGIIHHIQCASLADYVIRDSTKYILDSNAVLEIPDSTTLHFTGSNTALIMYQNSVIKLGVNSKIVIDSLATITAKGAQFTSLDSSGTWEGIVLENSGIDSIVNCTFSDAKTAVSIINDPGYSFAPRVFKGNTFNVPAGGDHTGIYGENNFRITIEDNVFNMPVNPANNVFGVFLKNNNTEVTESPFSSF